MGQAVGRGGSAGPHQPLAVTLCLTCFNKKHMYVCMYLYLPFLSLTKAGPRPYTYKQAIGLGQNKHFKLLIQIQTTLIKPSVDYFQSS